MSCFFCSCRFMSKSIDWFRRQFAVKLTAQYLLHIVM
uniref:Uncharacterized protein n=1 Tax=Arundo donax TaxID=35708 RepID=A0A0A9BY42_ARUDO